MSPYAPDERVLVSPRYMAGAGDRIADVIGPLTHLFGWKAEQNVGYVDVSVGSPDGSVAVDIALLEPLGRWIKVAHHEPYWEAVFSRQAPLEAVAAFTQALPQLLGDDRHAERIPVTREPLDQVAALNGWSAEGNSFVSPDRYCRIEKMPDADDGWSVEHVHFEGTATMATFTRDTPEHLVGNFFTHLASPIAVERDFADVPLNTQQNHSSLITPVRGAAINPQVAHALAQLGIPHRR
ncbi:DUF317 domain-containing protein [Streptomyces sp. NPDC057682]|uniref:DUF317 domain-containing protein n=1 Tax=Streptomyces sp. NPDC057682 TaxID=3346210 RepID=UPI0036C98039